MKKIHLHMLRTMGIALMQWVPSTLYSLLQKGDMPVHVLFCMVDHYEPGTGGVNVTTERGQVQRLVSQYPTLACKHVDFYGRHPKRTWFFPPHYHRHGNLRHLVQLCERGYGEIELHLHHGKEQPDTPENLEATLWKCIDDYSRFGIFGAQNGHKRYAFIHGDWALDNSRKGRFCGVNNELRILRQTGCYADFTFPSCNEANPFCINAVFYAKDDAKRPKSYNKGIAVRKGGQEHGDLMLIQGPLFPFLASAKPWLRYFGDAINGSPPVTERRIKAWIETGIHVRGKRDWIILKTHTHGAMYPEAVLGDEMDRIFTCLESKYNDGSHFILHYVTARELYNIIKAIEADESGPNPDEYRDYLVKPPQYDASPNIHEASDELKAMVWRTYRG